ncbi:hypothetical protein GGQ74_002341 [Desulfobaculum xiamenense]|uniref:Uncharacterized protein n=1 Tax=Desulfobaculum xiamenense TaxID=995050 RepID=A0A846QKE3_9BACT|nr:hypothetical protein [Desulfobaculum xiamenense]NJB68668.1 hypothetical protein [Desulfobaculum xiamenense]
MRKKRLVWLLTVSFVVMASAALAGTPPSILNGTKWTFTGIQFTGESNTTSTPSVFWGGDIQSYAPNDDPTTTTQNNGFGTASTADVTVFNFAGTSTTDIAAGAVDFANNATKWYGGSWAFEGDPGNLTDDDWDGTTNSYGLDGLVRLDNYAQSVDNTTDYFDYNFISNQDFSLFAGIGRTPIDSTAMPFADGPSFGVMFQNQSISNNTTFGSSTWYYYAYAAEGDGDDDGAAYLGTLTFNDGACKLYKFDTGSSTGAAVSTETTFNSTVTTGYVEVTTTGTAPIKLFSKANLSKNGNILAGYGVDANARLLHAIALKDAELLAQTDFDNDSKTFVGIGKGFASAVSSESNATAQGRIGKFLLSDNEVTDGNATYVCWNATSDDANGTTLSLADMDEMTFSVATSSSLAGVTHGNATLLDASDGYFAHFLGRKVDDVVVGIWVAAGTSNSTTAYGAAGDKTLGMVVMTDVAFVVPAATATTSADITTILSAFGTLASGVTVRAATAIDTSNIPSDASAVLNKSSDDLVTQFGLSSSAVVTNLTSFVATLPAATNPGDLCIFQRAIDGSQVHGKVPSEIGTYTKFYTAARAAVSGVSSAQTANSTSSFTYNPGTSTLAEGQYWLSFSTAPGYFIPSNFQLNQAFDYNLYFTIADNGAYDADTTADQITDPSGFVSGVSSTSGGGDGDGGCVFNPAAAWSIELVLMLLVPIAYLVRRKR